MASNTKSWLSLWVGNSASNLNNICTHVCTRMVEGEPRSTKPLDKPGVALVYADVRTTDHHHNCMVCARTITQAEVELFYINGRTTLHTCAHKYVRMYVLTSCVKKAIENSMNHATGRCERTERCM